MMDVKDVLDILRELARNDQELRQSMIAVTRDPNPVKKLSEISERLGYPMDWMELAFAGEDEYAAMRRSTNGGGENSPLLTGSDDYFDMFITDLENM